VKVALTDCSGEVTVVPHGAAWLQATLQSALRLKRRCVGQHQARERVQIRHAGALEHHLKIHA